MQGRWIVVGGLMAALAAPGCEDGSAARAPSPRIDQDAAPHAAEANPIGAKKEKGPVAYDGSRSALADLSTCAPSWVDPHADRYEVAPGRRNTIADPAPALDETRPLAVDGRDDSRGMEEVPRAMAAARNLPGADGTTPRATVVVRQSTPVQEEPSTTPILRTTTPEAQERQRAWAERLGPRWLKNAKTIRTAWGTATIRYLGGLHGGYAEDMRYWYGRIDGEVAVEGVFDGVALCESLRATKDGDFFLSGEHIITRYKTVRDFLLAHGIESEELVEPAAATPPHVQRVAPLQDTPDAGVAAPTIATHPEGPGPELEGEVSPYPALAVPAPQEPQARPDEESSEPELPTVERERPSLDLPDLRVPPLD